MRLLVLSRRRFLHSTRRLREAAASRGHAAAVVDPVACVPTVSGRGLELFHRGERLGEVDGLVPRVGRVGTAHTLAVAGHLEAMGVPTVNPVRAVADARDKLRALQLLAGGGTVVPRTALASPAGGLDAALERVGGVPVVLKLLHGTQGVGVILAESRPAVEATLDTLWALDRDVLLQEFVSESRGRDVRVFIVDGAVVAAMRRWAREGEWRSNVHRGARVEPVDLEPAYERVALDAVRILGLGVAGVDLLEGRDVPIVLEVNPSPGFEGLERATGADVAGRIVEYAERLADLRPEGGRHDQPRPLRPRLMR
ncbi:MAG TPA: RimK family alpha-L-glutamate ligase [Gemmatimonadota bacterium]|nr:RimK family alpha-L-glutamate ligase [Gemmatimonadota bacterium]